MYIFFKSWHTMVEGGEIVIIESLGKTNKIEWTRSPSRWLISTSILFVLCVMATSEILTQYLSAERHFARLVCIIDFAPTLDEFVLDLIVRAKTRCYK